MRIANDIWLNRDPIGEFGGLNLYAYLLNAPTTYVDPFGLELGDWWDPRSYANEGFLEGWSKGGQGIINAFSGGLPESGVLYDTFDQQWRDLGDEGIRCDSAFRFGGNAGRVSVGALAAAGGVWAWGASGLPTMSVAVGPGTPAFIHVAYGTGGTWVHATGRIGAQIVSATPGATIYAEVMSSFTVTGIPVLFPQAVIATGIPASTCVGAACRAFFRGWGL